MLAHRTTAESAGGFRDYSHVPLQSYQEHEKILENRASTDPTDGIFDSCISLVHHFRTIGWCNKKERHRGANNPFLPKIGFAEDSLMISRPGSLKLHFTFG